MNTSAPVALRGFTLIELLIALLILSLLSLMSYRSLETVLNTREHIRIETDKWRRVTLFFARFERDLQLAAARPVRTASGSAPAWRGHSSADTRARLEFSRFASSEGVDAPRRLAYQLNASREIELWQWPGLDLPQNAMPAHYPVLTGVETMELQYLSGEQAWVDTWPVSTLDAAIPQAVKLRIVLASGEEIVRVFAVNS